MNKPIQILTLFAALLVLSACAALSTPSTVPTTNATANNSDAATILLPGRVVFALSAQEETRSLGSAFQNASSIAVTIDSIALHSESKGWETVSLKQNTYDLVSLAESGDGALLADVSLLPHRYDRIQLLVSRVEVTSNNSEFIAVLPASLITLNAETVVLASKVSIVSLAVIGDTSLFRSTGGELIFAPELQVNTRTDATVSITDALTVLISAGQEQTSTRLGMDVAGNMVIGGTLPPYVQILPNGTITGTQSPRAPLVS